MTYAPITRRAGWSKYSGPRAGLALLGLALRGIARLTAAPTRDLFVRYYLLAGANSVATIMVRAAVLGTLLIGYVLNVVAADAQSAIHLLVAVVLREGGPLFAALIVMAQGGIEVTGQFARMRERGELHGWRLLGIDPLEFFCAPSLLGIAAATVVLTLYFNTITVVGGILFSSLITEVSVVELVERFLLHVQITDFLYAMFKSVLFGLAIGTVSCYHGLLAPLRHQGDGARLISRSVMQSLFLISIINALAAYIAHGIVFFGVVRL